MDALDREPVTIPESDMTFGPFRRESLFHIEKSESFRQLGIGFSTVEFVCIDRHGKVCFVEAKKSISNPDSTEDYRKNIQQIEQKFTDSFHLLLTCLLGRRAQSTMGEAILHLNLTTARIRFILVVKNHEKVWLVHIRETLIKNMRKIRKMWNIEIIVLNEEGAKEFELIQ
jgi:hypothetical protein